ncbi:MAG: hypothetical protein H0Z40_10345 [Desulfotomaculum sp.]|nr:hypothetical protein [Desulfotomaculum sp.]
MKKISIFLTAACILLLVGCVSQKPLEYRTLSEEEWQNFAEEHGITVLDVEEIKKSTNVLFKTEKEIGLYSLSVDSNGEMFVYKTSYNNNADVSPVSISYRTTGVPLVAAIINDKGIRSKADKIVVELENGDTLEESIKGRTGIIVASDSQVNSYTEVNKVKILDQQGEILYQH